MPLPSLGFSSLGVHYPDDAPADNTPTMPSLIPPRFLTRSALPRKKVGFFELIMLMVETEPNQLVAWREDGKSVFFNVKLCEKLRVLEKYFSSNKFSSLRRQLNTYGFTFYNEIARHEFFCRGMTDFTALEEVAYEYRRQRKEKREISRLTGTYDVGKGKRRFPRPREHRHPRSDTWN